MSKLTPGMAPADPLTTNATLSQLVFNVRVPVYRTIGSLSLYNLSSLTLLRLYTLLRTSEPRARKLRLLAHRASTASRNGGCKTANGQEGKQLHVYVRLPIWIDSEGAVRKQSERATSLLEIKANERILQADCDVTVELSLHAANGI
jgi:hypothetical protein